MSGVHGTLVNGSNTAELHLSEQTFSVWGPNHSVRFLSALLLVSKGSSLQNCCTKLKYPLYGKTTHTHKKELVAENQTIAQE